MPEREISNLFEKNTELFKYTGLNLRIFYCVSCCYTYHTILHHSLWSSSVLHSGNHIRPQKQKHQQREAQAQKKTPSRQNIPRPYWFLADRRVTAATGHTCTFSHTCCSAPSLSTSDRVLGARWSWNLGFEHFWRSSDRGRTIRVPEILAIPAPHLTRPP